MLTMPQINYIRHLREVESNNISEIVEKTGVNWRTAKKYADHLLVPELKIKPKKGMMYEEEWGQIVLDWLEEDKRMKRKNRRTIKKIFEELIGLEFKGSYRTVCQFIQDSDYHHGVGKNYERMEHPPGEVQVDFGHTEAVMEGNIIDVSCLVMSAPYSNAAYSVALPTENQECFLEGLMRLFKLIGKVPRVIRIDNLSAAVVTSRNNKKEAVLSDEFMMFSHYYGFQVQVCNAYAPNEKGNVENKVGYIRQNMLTPAPMVKNYEELNEELYCKNNEDHDREHYRKGIRIKDLLEEEKKDFLLLPEEDYPVFKKETKRLNKYGEMKIDSTEIYIPNSNKFKRLDVVFYWDKYEVYAPSGKLLHTDFRPYMRKKRKIPWDDILREWVKKPRVISYSRHARYLPKRIKSYLEITDLNGRKLRLKWILELLKSMELNQIEESFYHLVNQKDEQHHPYEVDWSHYDSLNTGVNDGS